MCSVVVIPPAAYRGIAQEATHRLFGLHRRHSGHDELLNNEPLPLLHIIYYVQDKR